MTLYFEKKLQFPPSAQLGNRIYSDVLWHSIHPLLAISAFDDKKGGLVSVYDHEKEETIDIDATPKQDIQVTSIAWHPTLTYLALGYETGEVMVWNHEENETFEGSKSHHGAVTIVRWSTDGSVLTSTDTMGSLVFWTCNKQGHIQPKLHQDFNDPVVQLLAMPLKDNTGEIKESVENLERSLGKMTSWRPKTAAKRVATAAVSGRTRSRGRPGGRGARDKSIESFDDEDDDNDPIEYMNDTINETLTMEDTEDADIGRGGGGGGGAGPPGPGPGPSRTTGRPQLPGSNTSASASKDTGPKNCFYVGLMSGAIFYLKDDGTSEEVLTAGSSIKHLLLQETRDVLIVMTEAFIMGQFKIDSMGALHEMNKVKLSGMGDIRISWVGPNTIGVLSKELSIRLWDLESNENSVLEADQGLSYISDEIFATVDYQNNTGVLACCTNKGKLIMWKENQALGLARQLNSNYDDITSEESNNWYWHNSTITSSTSQTKEIQWSQSVSGTIVVNGVRDIYVLTEHQLVAAHKDKVSIIQTQQNQATVSIITYIPPKPRPSTAEILKPPNPDVPEEVYVHKMLQMRLASRKKVPLRSKVKFVNFNITTEVQIKNFDLSDNFICIWSGQDVEVYEISTDPNEHYKMIGSFKDKCISLCLFEQSLYILETEHVQIRTFQGTLKQTLTFLSAEGSPISLAHTGEYITVATTLGYIKIWHIGQREAKVHATSPNLMDKLEDFGEVILAKNSRDGDKVAFTVAQKSLMTPDSRFFVWDLQNETITMIAFPGQFITQLYWEFESNTFIALELKAMAEEILAQSNAAVYSNKSKVVYGSSELNRVRQVIDVGGGDDGTGVGKVETGSATEIGQGDARNASASSTSALQLYEDSPPKPDNEFATVFHTHESGIVVHSKTKRDVETQLMGLEVPHLVVLDGKGAAPTDTVKSSSSRSGQRTETPLQAAKIVKRVLQDFDELDDPDRNSTAQAALTQYVYHCLMGEDDKALKVLRPITTRSIWVQLAKRCVVTKRLDIASMCFAHIQDARGVFAIQQAQHEDPDQVDVHLARLALHLQMNEEAFELYKRAGRYDILVNIYKWGGMWDEAIAICENHLRIQLRTTYYEYAKYLEEEEQIDEAIEMYEKSDTFRTEVPRLLAELSNVEKLEKYVLAKKDKELYKWWAQYLESGNDLDSALAYYEMADDWLSLVRLLCFKGEVDKAVQIAERVDDKASAYHLARAFEDAHDSHKSIHFYTKAQAYGSGIRVCKEFQLDDNLWGLALLADPIEQADAAKYFESKDEPDFDRAIRLYHKSGYGAKALDLAFATQEFGALQSIVHDLIQNDDQRIDPELLKKCADFFISNKQYDKALDTLAAAKRYVEAMEMCVEYNLQISEEMAERLTAPKGGDIDEATRLMLLMKMGECCLHQGSYQLAAKKFYQGGDKVQAIKALIKSGEAHRVITYAKLCKEREVYLIAAHYLQTTDLKGNPATVNWIIQFYRSAKSSESIISFYESCAQASAEEVDYSASLEHLRSAEKTTKELLESNNAGDITSDSRALQNRMQVIKERIGYVEKFLTVQKMLLAKNKAVSDIIQQLIEDPNVEMGVRRGDIYALLVETFTSLGQYEKAVEAIDEMKSILAHNPIKYFKGDTLQILQKAVGNQKLGLGRNSGSKKPRSKDTDAGDAFRISGDDEGEDDEEEVEEEVESGEDEGHYVHSHDEAAGQETEEGESEED